VNEVTELQRRWWTAIQEAASRTPRRCPDCGGIPVVWYPTLPTGMPDASSPDKVCVRCFNCGVVIVAPEEVERADQLSDHRPGAAGHGPRETAGVQVVQSQEVSR